MKWTRFFTMLFVLPAIMVNGCSKEQQKQIVALDLVYQGRPANLEWERLEGNYLPIKKELIIDAEGTDGIVFRMRLQDLHATGTYSGLDTRSIFFTDDAYFTPRLLKDEELVIEELTGSKVSGRFRAVFSEQMQNRQDRPVNGTFSIQLAD